MTPSLGLFQYLTPNISLFKMCINLSCIFTAASGGILSSVKEKCSIFTNALLQRDMLEPTGTGTDELGKSPFSPVPEYFLLPVILIFQFCRFMLHYNQ
jgi:hypothetical protein